MSSKYKVNLDLQNAQAEIIQLRVERAAAGKRAMKLESTVEFLESEIEKARAFSYSVCAELDKLREDKRRLLEAGNG